MSNCEKCGASRMGTERLCFHCGEPLPRVVPGAAPPQLDDEQTHAMCLVHGQLATAFCSRCGAFNCQRCEPLSDGLCSDCKPPRQPVAAPRLAGGFRIPVLAILLAAPLTFLANVLLVGLRVQRVGWQALTNPALYESPHALQLTWWSLVTSLLLTCLACYLLLRLFRRGAAPPA